MSVQAYDHSMITTFRSWLRCGCLMTTVVARQCGSIGLRGGSDLEDGVWLFGAVDSVLARLQIASCPCSVPFWDAMQVPVQQCGVPDCFLFHMFFID
jgi:hypothetical protein